MKYTVKDLKRSLVGVPDDVAVAFQGNIRSEEDTFRDEPSHTTCTGYVYSSWLRDNDLVLDCAITEKEI